MNERALIQRMVDALQSTDYPQDHYDTIAAAREYLAAPEQSEKHAIENRRIADEYNALVSMCKAQLDELSAISKALGTNEGHSSVDHILALRNRLAAPEQLEPVAIFRADEDGDYVELIAYQGQPMEDGAKLYTAAPQPTELNYEELLGAIARGWCTPINERKVMDSDLAIAIAEEVVKYLAAQRSK